MPEKQVQVVGENLIGHEVAAFEHAVGQHWDGVARFASRLLNDREAAKDVSQEAFVRLWLARKHMTDESVRPFLYRVARNLAADELRRRSVRSRWAASQPEAETDAGPEAILHAKERDSKMAHAVQGLAPRRREALILAYVHGLSYQEIAKVMGISVATVRNQISSALADLRGVLAPHTL